MSELVSVNKFAGLMGVDESLIRRNITAGRFSDKAVIYDEQGRRKMDLEVAKLEFEKLGIGSEKDRRLQASPKPGDPSKSEQETPALVRPSTVKPTPGFDDDNEVPDLNKSRQMAEYYKAKMAEIEFNKMAGSVVEKAEVYRELAEASGELRRALFTIPDQKIDEIIAAKSRAEAHGILYTAIEAELLRFVKGHEPEVKEKAPE